MRFTDNNAITAANMVDADILAGTDVSTGEDKKFPVGNLADYMLANRTQPVGGASQSITSAINANTSAIGELETSVDKKADADGEYDDLVVGTSKQLLSDTYAEDFTPYKYRRSPYTDRLSESIVGASVAWNQLVQNVNVASAVYGITRTKITGDKLGLHYSGTSTNSTNFTAAPFAAVSGHKYYLTLGATLPTGCKINISSVDRTSDGFYAASSSATVNFGLTITSGTAVDLDTFPQAFDLTQMFGTAVADALYAMGADGVALFRSWYPNDYYPFSNPTMEHVSGLEAHEMVGWNQFVEEWESGYYDISDGAKGASATWQRCKDKVRCVPNTDYFLIQESGGNFSYILFYDADENYLSYTSGANAGSVGVTVTTPSNAAYMAFYRNASVNNGKWLNVNISDPTRNGTYKPYSKHTYALDASLTLRGLIKYDSSKGIYADGDTYAPDGTVERRFGVVDLGTLNWVSGGTSVFAATLTGLKVGTNGISPVLCARYTTQNISNVNSSVDKSIWQYYNTANIRVYDSAYSDIASFKAAMSGTYLVYEKSTVTTESAEPYDEIQITDGTEEYVSDCLAPVGHESKYYANLRSKIEGLPTDFSAIICATEPTSKASKNYAVGDYLIYNNTLYKVTTAIATNATLTVGTNITATTIMAEIKALQ